ncbi:MAG: AbrB/MazE/SpoVT family DNA-binding domain-containing protein [Dehalococcoidia bacterium]|nr:AbrB/MazE/SpoVT family DNA-binding domain-containing protein [Dehalococcoidia bacterium]
MTRKVAKLFMNGRSQAVRIPKEFRFEGSEVYIEKDGNRVVLSPKKDSIWREFFEKVPAVSDDFSVEPRDMPAEERDWS